MQHRNRTVALDSHSLRLAFELLVTGVTVAAAEVATGSCAVALNIVRPLSLDSGLVLLCPRKKSRVGTLFPIVERFTVNVLGDDQRELATLFSGLWRGRSRPPFRFVASAAGPRLSGAPISLGCALRRAVDLGEHSMLIGQVVDIRCDLETRKPLLGVDAGSAGRLWRDRAAPAGVSAVGGSLRRVN